MKLLQCHIRVRSVYIYKNIRSLFYFFQPTERIFSNESAFNWNHIDSIKSIFFVQNSVIATMIMTLNVDKKPMIPMVAGISLFYNLFIIKSFFKLKKYKLKFLQVQSIQFFIIQRICSGLVG